MMLPFTPHKLPIENISWAKHIRKIGAANAELARYDGILQGIINPAVLLSPLMSNEAVISSKIEGTQATLQEVLEFEAAPDINNPKYADIQEILNYRKAMEFASDWLKEKPITLNMIKNTHAILMDSVRGQNKSKGEFRKLQNWIGRPGCKIEEASYIPPDPMFLLDFLSDWEKYIHFDEQDGLIQLAVIHAQFEIIHPFLDGNGRIGRMIMPLFLFGKNLLSSPMFYISEYLEKNRAEYYRLLNSISANNDWDSWIDFFLTAIIEQSKINSKKAKDILHLYETKKNRIAELTHSQFVYNIVDTLFKTPIFNTSTFLELSEIPRASTKRFLNILVENKILTIIEQGKGRRPTIYLFNKLFDITKF